MEEIWNGGGELKGKRLEILGLIPARGGSKGIPGKNLRLLGDKSLVALAVESALKSCMITRLVLSTDSEAISKEGKHAGAEVPFMRPEDLALDETPTAPVVIHALRWLEDNGGYRPDILILLQPTAPLRQAEHIDGALDLLISTGARCVISVTEVPGHYNPFWQFLTRDGSLRPFMDTLKAPSRRQDLPPTYTRNGAIYAAWTDNWLTGTLSNSHGCAPYVMQSEESVNIDSPEDLALAELLLARRQKER